MRISSQPLDAGQPKPSIAASGAAVSREKTIFNAALQFRDPAKRAMYLDLACEDDPG